MKIRILLILLFATVVGQAQTKVIAHKSHSGSNHSFAKAYKKGLFDINQYNFGLPNTRPVVILDKVIALNDSVTVLQKRESIVCQRLETDYSHMKDSDFTVVTDTLINHKLFTKKNTASFIKSSKSNYRFSNPMTTVKFVGFKK